MGVGPDGKAKAGRLGLWLGLAVVVILGAGLGFLYLSKPLEFKAPAALAGPSAGAWAKYAKGGMSKLEVAARPSKLADLAFNDADGKPVDVARFRGKVVVVNLWATWCAPCVTEMPTLAALQRAYPDDVVVLAVSMDTLERIPNARDFLGVHEPLALYHDPRFALPSALGIKGLPGTVLYDREGREVARVMGEADWVSPEARALIDALVKT